MRFMYSVIQYVPDPARGEFVNVGVIAGSEEAGEWDLRTVENMRRARALGGSVVTVDTFTDAIGREIDAYYDAQEEGIEGVRVLDETWLADLAEHHHNVIQLTRPAPVSAESVDEAMATISQHLLVDPESSHLGYVRRTRARAALRTAYKSADIRPGENLFDGVSIRVGQSLIEHVDFAVANGKPVQLAQAWSFQTPDQRALARRLRSWAWSIRKLRQLGGEVTLAEGRTAQLSRDIDLEVVVVPPMAAQTDVTAWHEAQDTFEELDAHSTAFSDVAKVTARATALLLDSH